MVRTKVLILAIEKMRQPLQLWKMWKPAKEGGKEGRKEAKKSTARYSTRVWH